jgi:hypothetical protein
MSSTDVQVQSGNPALRVALGVAAVIVSIIVNTGVAIATKSLDPSTRTGLDLIAYGPATAWGVIAGTAGWAAVRRFAAQPRAVLRVLVSAVVALSFVPGLILLAGDTSPVNVAGLWVMHLVVALVTVTLASRVLPLADKNS